MTDGKVKVEYKCGHASEVEYGTVHDEPHYISEMRRRIKAESKLKLCGPCHHGARKYELTKVCIDDLVGPVEAYVIAGERWNGWEMPHFTRANADLLMALWNAAGEKLAEDPKACLQSVMSYDAERDAYIVTFPEDEQATETFEIENILVDGEYVRVYAIGAGSWTWDREDTAEDAYMATLSSHVTSLDPTKGYIIVDAKGDGYYNDTTVYDTPEAAEIALAEAQAWAQEEAKREPSWALAKLRIEEVSK
jgi:hypothetical protein